MNVEWLTSRAALISAVGTFLLGVAALWEQLRATRSKRNKILVFIWILFLGFSFIVFAARLSSRRNPPSGQSVEIIYPQDGQRVDRRIEVHGKEKNMPSGREVWVFVKSAKSDYYLYLASSSDPSAEEWRTQICVGQPESDETEFTILACPVERQARGIFLEDHRPPCEKRISQLPSTIRMAECSKKTVYLEPQTLPPIEKK
jgi:hypothetical protein